MNLVKASKRLSFLLRHCQEPLYVELDGGWASVGAILGALGLTRAQLDEIVATDVKRRYAFNESGMKIRANQGHSIPGVTVEMESPEPPEFLYHGTATRFLDGIMRDGLKPMSRQWVHISPDFETAVNVGKRHGKPVVLVIRAREFPPRQAPGVPGCALYGPASPVLRMAMSCICRPMEFGRRGRCRQSILRFII